jgi:hypothetical protein
MSAHRWRALTARGRLVVVAMALAAASACEHPLAIVSAHVEAADLVVADSSGIEITRTEFNRSWRVDSLVLRDGESLAITFTPIDFRGNHLDLSDRGDVTFRVQAERAELVQWEPQRGFGWLRPFGRGETRLRFLIWHNDHADFVTPWLRVVIH